MDKESGPLLIHEILLLKCKPSHDVPLITNSKEFEKPPEEQKHVEEVSSDKEKAGGDSMPH
eukprot:1223134-Karenia_brevis.AAC.1